jgi:hypothetical protein
MSVSNFELDITSRVAAGDGGSETPAALVWQPTLTLWQPNDTAAIVDDSPVARNDAPLAECAAGKPDAITATGASPLHRRRRVLAARNVGSQGQRNCRAIWRGDSSLARTFWAYAVLQSVIAASLSRPSWEDWAGNVAVAIFAILIALQLGAAAVFLRAIWLATRRYSAQGLPAPLCGIARGASLMLLIASIYSAILTGAPRWLELRSIADGVIPTGNYHLRLVRGGTELAIDGAIGIGLSKNVSQILDRKPLVQALQLNSNGGSAREARKLRDLIAKRRLATTTSQGCHGECTLAYIAGEPRRIGDQAKLSFYRSSGQYGLSAWALWRDYQHDLRDWLARGVPRFFAEQALTPRDGAGWQPSRSELIAAHIVSPSLATVETQGDHGDQNTLALLDHELRRAPFFTLLKEQEPAGYRKLIGEVHAGLKSSDNSENFQLRIYPMAKAVAYQRLAHAEDTLLLDYAEMILEQISLLYSESAEICNRYFGMDLSGAALDTAKYFSEEMLVNETAIMAEVLRSSATREYQPPARQAIQARWNMLMAHIGKRYGSNAVLFFETRPAKRDADQTCHVLYEFYKAVTRLPAQEAGPVLRFHFAQLQARSLPQNPPTNPAKQVTSLSSGGANPRVTH